MENPALVVAVEAAHVSNGLQDKAAGVKQALQVHQLTSAAAARGGNASGAAGKAGKPRV